MPEPPDSFNHNLIRIPPLFRIAFPEGIIHHAELIGWQTTSSWYFVSSHPLYFDILCRGRRNSKRHRFRIIIEPDLSDASLQLINASELSPPGVDKRVYQRYNICEDTLVSCWYDYTNPSQYGAYIGLTLPRFAHLISHDSPSVIVPLTATRPEYDRSHARSLCPASGRFVYLDRAINRIVVHDFF